MLCPEVSNFPPPKLISSSKKFENVESVSKTFEVNNFYSSLIITCPDQLQIPDSIEECLLEDNDYYKITDCPLTEFVEPTFIDKFVKNGKLYCLSADTNCIVQNCAAVTPDGILTLHILEYIFQTIGLEGTKRPHDFYEVKIDLNCINKHEKLRQCLKKLGTFNFYVSWEPKEEKICPSSLARYFYERNIGITVNTLQCQNVIPTITEVPSVNDVPIEEMVEWVGLLAHDADFSATDSYISSYFQPESEYALKTSRISVLISKGFITPSIISNVCRKVHDYVISRELDNYWASVSVQSNGNGLWHWNPSCPRMFQPHDSSSTVFFTNDCQMMYSMGQLKYS